MQCDAGARIGAHQHGSSEAEADAHRRSAAQALAAVASALAACIVQLALAGIGGAVALDALIALAA